MRSSPVYVRSGLVSYVRESEATLAATYSNHARYDIDTFNTCEPHPNIAFIAGTQRVLEFYLQVNDLGGPHVLNRSS